MNYEAKARSNYFAVKDESAFRTWAKSACLRIGADGGTESPTPRFCLLAEDGWPSTAYALTEDGDYGESRDFDIVQELPEHLAKGEIAILMQVGNEGMRYLTGEVWAIRSDEEVRYISLTSDIMKLAEELRESPDAPLISRPEY